MYEIGCSVSQVDAVLVWNSEHLQAVRTFKRNQATRKRVSAIIKTFNVDNVLVDLVDGGGQISNSTS